MTEAGCGAGTGRLPTSPPGHPARPGRAGGLPQALTVAELPEEGREPPWYRRCICPLPRRRRPDELRGRTVIYLDLPA